MGKKLSNIKEILSNIDYDYDNADWKKLERDLQKQNRYSRFSKLGYTSLATVVVLAIVAIYFSNYL